MSVANTPLRLLRTVHLRSTTNTYHTTVELARPGRPPADVSSASRITLAALGIRKPREKKAGTPTSARKGLKAAATASGKSGGVRGRGARPQEPAESTDSWDM